MSDMPKSRPIYRPMARCIDPACKRWVSVGLDDHDPAPGPFACACGASVELVDAQAHLSTLPVAKPDH